MWLEHDQTSQRREHLEENKTSLTYTAPLRAVNTFSESSPSEPLKRCNSSSRNDTYTTTQDVYTDVKGHHLHKRRSPANEKIVDAVAVPKRCSSKHLGSTTDSSSNNDTRSSLLASDKSKWYSINRNTATEDSCQMQNLKKKEPIFEVDAATETCSSENLSRNDFTCDSLPKKNDRLNSVTQEARYKNIATVVEMDMPNQTCSNQNLSSNDFTSHSLPKKNVPFNFVTREVSCKENGTVVDAEEPKVWISASTYSSDCKEQELVQKEQKLTSDPYFQPGRDKESLQPLSRKQTSSFEDNDIVMSSKRNNYASQNCTASSKRKNSDGDFKSTRVYVKNGRPVETVASPQFNSTDQSSAVSITDTKDESCLDDNGATSLSPFEVEINANSLSNNLDISVKGKDESATFAVPPHTVSSNDVQDIKNTDLVASPSDNVPIEMHEEWFAQHSSLETCQQGSRHEINAGISERNSVGYNSVQAGKLEKEYQLKSNTAFGDNPTDVVNENITTHDASEISLSEEMESVSDSTSVSSKMSDTTEGSKHTKYPFVVVLSNLPPSMKRQDIVALFEEKKYAGFVKVPRPRQKGKAIAVFSNAEQASNCAKQMKGNCIRGRNIYAYARKDNSNRDKQLPKKKEKLSKNEELPNKQLPKNEELPNKQLPKNEEVPGADEKVSGWLENNYYEHLGGISEEFNSGAVQGEYVVVVKNFPNSVSREQLYEIFSKNCPGIRETRLTQPGCGEIVFDSKKDVEICLRRKHTVCEKMLTVYWKEDMPSNVHCHEQESKEKMEKQKPSRKEKRRRRQEQQQQEQDKQEQEQQQRQQQKQQQQQQQLKSQQQKQKQHQQLSLQQQQGKNEKNSEQQQQLRLLMQRQIEVQKGLQQKQQQQQQQQHQQQQQQQQQQQKLTKAPNNHVVQLRGFPLDTGEQEIRKFVKDQLEGVEILNLVKTEEKCFSLKLNSEDDCQKVCETLRGSSFKGAEITPACKGRNKTSQDKPYVVVENLHQNISKKDVNSYFVNCQGVVDINVTKESKITYARVYFESVDSAGEAVERMTGFPVGREKLKVTAGVGISEELAWRKLERQLQEYWEHVQKQKKYLLAKNGEKLKVLENSIPDSRPQRKLISLEEFNRRQETRETYEGKKQELIEQRNEFENKFQQLLESFNQQIEDHRSVNNKKGMEDILKIHRNITNREFRKFKASLPIYAKRAEILETVGGSQIVVLVGETGSGKSTQLAQYLAEEMWSQDKKIVVTQPRKIAAISLAKRVSEEYGCKVGQEVGYHVGLDKKINGKTIIKFVTDRILLNEVLKGGETMQQYSCIVIDEAHERSIHTDLLVAMLKRRLTSFPHLKLIVTSATLNTEVFRRYFDNCPLVTVPGRTFPVERVYTRERPENYDYVDGVYEKVMEVCESGEQGDILVFLTQQNEIEKTCDKLEKKLGRGSIILPLHGKLQSEEQQKVLQCFCILY